MMHTTHPDHTQTNAAGLRSVAASWMQLYQSLTAPDALPLTVQRVMLGAILVLCLVIRLTTIQAPAIDRPAWKEIDYITVSRNFWQHGFNFFQPEVDWPADPPRVTAMEFPLVPYLTAVAYQFLGFNAYSVRLIPLLSWLLMTLYIFLLARHEFGPVIGLLAALVSVVLPLNNQFGRWLLSEPLIIATSVMTVFHFAQWTSLGKKRDWWLAACGFTIAIALNVTPLYLLLPLAWIVFRKYRWQIKQYRSLVLLTLIALIVPAAWYAYAYQLELTGVHHFSVFFGHNKSQTLTMLSSAAWYTTMVERLTKGILGGNIGTGLCIVGMVGLLALRRGGLVFAYTAAIGAFFVLVAEGQIDAPYRQLTIVPPLSIFVAFGAVTLIISVMAFIHMLRRAWLSNHRLVWLCAIGATLLVCLVFYECRRSLRSTDPLGPAHGDRWRFAQEVKQYTDTNSRLATIGEYTMHVGGNDLSPVLFYYTGLRGWIIQPNEPWDMPLIDRLIRQGATHLAVLHPFNSLDYRQLPETAPFMAALKSRFTVLFENTTGFLIDLKQPVTGQLLFQP